MDKANSRKAWTAAIVGLMLSPLAGLMRLNKGKLALYYFSGSLVLVALPFVVAHYIPSTFDPRRVTFILPWVINIVGAVHCYLIARHRRSEPLKWYAKWSVIVLLCYVLPIGFAIGVRSLIFETFYVASKSMEPTLQKEEYFIVDKGAYNTEHPPQRGDIIVFNVHKGTATTKHIKRIVGMGGDKMDLFRNTITINGASIQKREGTTDNDGQAVSIETFPDGKEITVIGDFKHADDTTPRSYEVPTGQYFVLGDNRGMSIDSSNVLGYVEQSDIIGKATRVFWNEKTYKFTYTLIE